MKNTTGFYPRLIVDTSLVAAVGQAGGVLLTETVRASGLGRELSAALGRWRKPTAVHDPAKVVLDLALGGDCLADIALLRADPDGRLTTGLRGQSRTSTGTQERIICANRIIRGSTTRNVS